MTIDTSKISKTTVNGVISAGIAVVIAVMALPPKASALVITLAALRALSGYLQKDAVDESGSNREDAEKTKEIEKGKAEGQQPL